MQARKVNFSKNFEKLHLSKLAMNKSNQVFFTYKEVFGFNVGIEQRK